MPVRGKSERAKGIPGRGVRRRGPRLAPHVSAAGQLPQPQVVRAGGGQIAAIRREGSEAERPCLHRERFPLVVYEIMDADGPRLAATLRRRLWEEGTDGQEPAVGREDNRSLRMLSL